MLQLYELTGLVDLRAVVCDPEKLTRYLIFPSSVDVRAVSYSLCTLNVTLAPNITNTLQRQIDVAKILRIVRKTLGL